MNNNNNKKIKDSIFKRMGCFKFFLKKRGFMIYIFKEMFLLTFWIG